eukprot:COSAG03_NODE_20536_length_317_cov_1.348624_1_plen_62_part_10
MDDFATRLREHAGRPYPRVCDALAAYFAAVNAPVFCLSVSVCASFSLFLSPCPSFSPSPFLP